MTVIRKSTTQLCRQCAGKDKNCRACDGTGQWKDSHYTFIDDKQKIAIDGDTCK